MKDPDPSTTRIKSTGSATVSVFELTVSSFVYVVFLQNLCTYMILVLLYCQQKTRLYRDRAAERRTLHGGFGIGPGQKSSVNNDSSVGALGSDSADAEVAAAEAIEMSFGAGSYARRLLENMGWKEVGILQPYLSLMK